MSLDLNDPADIEHLLWDEIERHQVGMLMLVGGRPRHAQPMTAFVEQDARQLWFFADLSTDLARSVRANQGAMFVWQQKDLQACISGRLCVRHDRGRMDRYWNAVVASWHPKGRSDPGLTMLSMQCEDALVWVSTAGPMKAVWEIAKANAMRREPDVGARTHLAFH
ncbi:MAG TPA: pyridoxamine 5'-phosphate oxidase family protein [Caulobacteraceae bacterium]|jgi:general stress protein 26|nr:pyridoxamine 5'-phosphate oxidase family protein [Caulobacteraceae bacterium]